MFDSILKVYKKLCVAGMMVGLVFLMAQMAYGFFNVILRYFFNFPIPGTIEFTAEAMIYVIFFPAALVQMQRRHVRIDFILEYTPPRVRDVLDILTYALGIVFFALIGWHSIEPAFESFKIKETVGGTVPFLLYPQKFTVCVGAFMLVGQFLLDMLQLVRKLVTGGEYKEIT